MLIKIYVFGEEGGKKARAHTPECEQGEGRGRKADLALCMEPRVGLGLTTPSPLTEPPGAPNSVLSDAVICESQMCEWEGVELREEFRRNEGRRKPAEDPRGSQRSDKGRCKDWPHSPFC